MIQGYERNAQLEESRQAARVRREKFREKRIARKHRLNRAGMTNKTEKLADGIFERVERVLSLFFLKLLKCKYSIKRKLTCLESNPVIESIQDLWKQVIYRKHYHN
jgi:hypothetical protein